MEWMEIINHLWLLISNRINSMIIRVRCRTWIIKIIMDKFNSITKIKTRTLTKTRTRTKFRTKTRTKTKMTKTRTNKTSKTKVKTINSTKITNSRSKTNSNTNSNVLTNTKVETTNSSSSSSNSSKPNPTSLPMVQLLLVSRAPMITTTPTRIKTMETTIRIHNQCSRTLVTEDLLKARKQTKERIWWSIMRRRIRILRIRIAITTITIKMAKMEMARIVRVGNKVLIKWLSKSKKEELVN